MGKIGVKGLFLEYGEYSAEYSPTPSLKPLSRFASSRIWVIWLGLCTVTVVLDAYDTVGRVRLGTGAQQMMMGLVGEYMLFEKKKNYLTLGTSSGRMDVEEYICPECQIRSPEAPLLNHSCISL